MKRVAIIADSHFHENSRFDECVRVHSAILDEIERIGGVDVIGHAGDFLEKASTPRERLAGCHFVRRAAGIAPMVFVRGNHDALGDLLLFEQLDTKFPVYVEEKASVRTVNGVTFALVAWPRKAELLAAAGAKSAAAGGDAARAALRSLFEGLGAEMDESLCPKLALAHAMVRGSRTSVGQPLVGCDLEVGLEDLALLRADAYALGHIHAGQSWGIGGSPVFYPGSPRRTSFGELEAKGFVLVTFEDGKTTHEFIEVPTTPMILVERTWTADGWNLDDLGVDYGDAKGAEVRVRVNTVASLALSAKAATEELCDAIREAGALSVKVEERIVPETRARAPGVATAATLEAKLEALWESRGFDPGARRAELISKAHEIEGNPHVAA